MPIVCVDEYFYKLEVFRYEINGEKKYCIINQKDGYYYITSTLPEDLDVRGLVGDINDQYRLKTKPRKMRSKFETICRKYYQEAWRIIDGDKMSDADQELLPLYNKFVEKEDDEDDEWAEVDQNTEEYSGAKCLIAWKITADLLKKDGYDYEDMKNIGDFDHHDVENYDIQIKGLKDGFFWEKFLMRARA